MKTPQKIISLLAGSALAAATFLNAATTDPVGYITVSTAGDGGTSIVTASGMVKPVEASGIGVVSAGTTLTSTDSNWAINAFAVSHYVQIDGSGEWAAISSNTADTLTLDSIITNGADLNFTIRALSTLGNLFGESNSSGFRGGASFGQGDIIGPWSAATNSLAGFYYYDTDGDGEGTGEWRDITNNFAGNTIIYPDESLLVISPVGSAVNNIIITGTVQKGAASGEIIGDSQTNILPNPYPVPLALKSSGYENSIQGSTGFGAPGSDIVGIWDDTSQNWGPSGTAFYYYNTDANEWRDLFNNAIDETVVIPTGNSAVIIKNSTGNSQWAISQTY